MSESQTRINVIKMPFNGPFRPVKIEGRLDCVKRGARKVIDLVEHMLCKMQEVQYRKRPQIDKNVTVKAKLILPDDALSEIVGAEGEFAQGLAHQYKVDLTIYKNKKIRSVDDSESIMVAFSFTLRRLPVALSTPKILSFSWFGDCTSTLPSASKMEKIRRT